MYLFVFHRSTHNHDDLQSQTQRNNSKKEYKPNSKFCILLKWFAPGLVSKTLSFTLKLSYMYLFQDNSFDCLPNMICLTYSKGNTQI